MQFFYPSVFYALLALLIPIIIHLFKLRRFKRVNFTNIAFLKKVEVESRKSAQLKKWLALLSRLLLLICLIIAFAQPFFPLNNQINKDTELIIYIDNSFSMQAEGKRGSLLEEAQQSVINLLSEGQKISLITNTHSFRNLNFEDAKTELLKITFTANNTRLENKLKRAKSLQNKANASSSKIVLISDFEGVNEIELTEILRVESLLLVQLQPEIKTNTWIKNVELKGDSFQPKLNITIETNELKPEDKKEIVLSVLDNTEILARKTLSFEAVKTQEILLPLTKTSIEKGIVSIETDGLLYDKEFFFSISDRVQIQIKHLYENEPATFINRIYNSPRFSYEQVELNNFDFSELSNTQLVIVDNLSQLTKVQETQFINFVNNDGSLVIIPSTQIDLISYGNLLQSLQLPSFKKNVNNSVAITNISTNHPLFEGVFKDHVTNFDYPTVNSYYSLSDAIKPIISLVNKDAFLFNKGNVYVFSANIHAKNSNLSKSPLIVPIFYQIAIQSSNSDKISLAIESNESIKIPTTTPSNKVIKLATKAGSVIPNQQQFGNTIEVFAENYPSQAGTFEILHDEESLGYLSFNYMRNQSNNQYLISGSFEAENFTNSTKKMKEMLSLQPKVNELWQWFLMFALFFMLTEFLILRFIK